MDVSEAVDRLQRRDTRATRAWADARRPPGAATDRVPDAGPDRRGPSPRCACPPTWSPSGGRSTRTRSPSRPARARPARRCRCGCGASTSRPSRPCAAFFPWCYESHDFLLVELDRPGPAAAAAASAGPAARADGPRLRLGRGVRRPAGDDDRAARVRPPPELGVLEFDPARRWADAQAVRLAAADRGEPPATLRGTPSTSIAELLRRRPRSRRVAVRRDPGARAVAVRLGVRHADRGHRRHRPPGRLVPGLVVRQRSDHRPRASSSTSPCGPAASRSPTRPPS